MHREDASGVQVSETRSGSDGYGRLANLQSCTKCRVNCMDTNLYAHAEPPPNAHQDCVPDSVSVRSSEACVPCSRPCASAGSSCKGTTLIRPSKYNVCSPRVGLT